MLFINMSVNCTVLIQVYNCTTQKIMADHNGNAEGKRLPRMAATFMMRFASEREPTFGIHRASVTPPVPYMDPEDAPHTGEESKSPSPDLWNLTDMEETSAVGSQTSEIQPLDSPPRVEESDRGSPSVWSLADVTTGENILEDSTDELPMGEQRNEGIMDE